ncbi:hypothetical protein FQV27_02080 [Paracoccus aurantiacus]|uniref:Uncharacterized protein n=1 Tax=Paracoccus aurantiacus TaxID=2599412 RepID=A0A5C6S8H0_9RHOB|nr:hypothetical protein [Paracoccus aurantiacus]TXB70678.1 hypothetical protein FQV27_02080 [Paracoccus aurantiacus]
MAYLNTFVFVYPDGATVPILAHEVAHAELHKRVGVLRFIGGAVPAWFDEGLAVYISGDERYLDVKNGTIIGCRDTELAELPSDGRLFRHLAASNANALYTASACKVIDWMNEHDGMRGVIRFEQSVRSGTAFSG